jgi:hypothetical protein
VGEDPLDDDGAFEPVGTAQAPEQDLGHSADGQPPEDLVAADVPGGHSGGDHGSSRVSWARA